MHRPCPTTAVTDRPLRLKTQMAFLDEEEQSLEAKKAHCTL